MSPFHFFIDLIKAIRNIFYSIKYYLRYQSVYRNIKKAYRIFSVEGFIGVMERLTGAKSSLITDYSYILPTRPPNLEDTIASFSKPIKFSIVVPLYNTPEQMFKFMVNSVIDQWYENWELILVDDASPEPQVRKLLNKISDSRVIKLLAKKNLGISGATNMGLKHASGDYIVFLDHDDELTVDCFFEIAQCIDRDNPDYIYSDEDLTNKKSSDHFGPFFKPDWSPDTLMSLMYTCHVSCVRRTLLKKVGRLRSEYDGAQDWDLILRVTEQTKKISHISKVLYHWRVHASSTTSGVQAKPYAVEMGKRVREDALTRRGVSGALEVIPQNQNYLSVNYHIVGSPLISIIIPSRDNGKILQKCIESIDKITIYRNFEIIVIDNGSVKDDTLTLLNQLQQKSITVHRHDAPFNYSELNNIGYGMAKGEILLFLNDDTEVLQEDWLYRLSGYAQQPHIGAVGAKLLFPHGNRLQHVGIVNPRTGGPFHLFMGANKDTFGYKMRNVLEYDWIAVTGACLMIEKSKFKKIGGFDEKLPYEYNDVELGMRLVKTGYFNVVCQQVTLIHHESLSRSDKLSPEKIEMQKQDRDYLKKLYPDYMEKDPFYNVNFKI